MYTFTNVLKCQMNTLIYVCFNKLPSSSSIIPSNTHVAVSTSDFLSELILLFFSFRSTAANIFNFLLIIYNFIADVNNFIKN